MAGVVVAACISVIIFGRRFPSEALGEAALSPLGNLYIFKHFSNESTPAALQVAHFFHAGALSQVRMFVR